MSDKFSIGDVNFELQPMKVRESDALKPHIVALIAPMLGMAIDGNHLLEALMKRAPEIAAATKEIPILRDAFAAKCSVQIPGEFGGHFVPLSSPDFIEKAFARKHSLSLKWLMKCVTLEFADFLPGLLSSLEG
jgi:hypothetical protein